MSYKYDNYREDIMPFIPANANTFLDIGCGTGKLIGKLKHLGKTCYGVEPSKDAAIIAMHNADRLINKGIEDSLDEIPDNFFDVILLLDILEHTVDPLIIIKQLKSKVNTNGIIISSIPNIRYYHTFIDLITKKEFYYTDAGVMDNTHLRFFTYKSILKLYDDAGYTIIQQKGINPTPSRKLKLLNMLSFGNLWDCQFMQFVTIGKPKLG